MLAVGLRLLTAFVVVGISTSISLAEDAPHRNTGFLDFNFYPYTDVPSDNAMTVNALSNLDHGFQYFSLTNFGRDPSRDALRETNNILTEQNLRWQIPGEFPIAIAAQALIVTGDDNDTWRLGPRWALHESAGFEPWMKAGKLKYWVAFYGAQLDHKPGYQWQIEHVFLWNVFPERFGDRVYVAGFADHNINHADGPTNVWIAEAQLGIRLYGDCYFVAEQRHNGFRVGEESSLGIGLEYVVRFK